MGEGRRYQIRQAAGKCWLLDMEQTGPEYIPPTPLNESSGVFLRSFLETGDPELGCLSLVKEYGITPEQARRDAQELLQSLRERNVRI